MNQEDKEKLYTLPETCELLSISTATGRNWMKSGRLVPSACSGEVPLFSEDFLLSLQHFLASGDLSALKNRRNKSYVTGKQTYHSYISKDSPNHAALQQLLALLAEATISLSEESLLCLLRNCAKQLLSQSGAKYYESFLETLVPSDIYDAFFTQYTALSAVFYTYLPEEDTLGFLYMSLRNAKDRKASGSYYTPAWLAKRLTEQHLPAIDPEKNFLDPSCGTGIFLMQLPKQIPLSNLFGSDVNPVSVVLARINLAMKYQLSSKQEAEILEQNITVSDYLCNVPASHGTIGKRHLTHSYDVILGNPPWGAKLSATEKKNYRRQFSCASGSSVETFDLFIEQSLTYLSPGGVLSFVLPESVLSVKAHTPVRELLLHKTAVLSVEYLGEVFEQVHCPSIILTVTKNADQPFFKDVRFYTGEGEFSTLAERTFHADNFAFALTDSEYLLLQKIMSCPNHTTLVDHADFALGIVTGNNSALLRTTPAPGLEPIVKGTDISKYHINSPDHYLAFHPEQFQQTAPESLYRAPEKLFYRFINKQLIFAYDNTGLLSLNSCNILIPHINGRSIKYILAILNSSVAQFVFEKSFHSVKVLRSHLEQIPIPLADADTQKDIVTLAEALMLQEENSTEYRETYRFLDRKIAELFCLTKEEFKDIIS